MFSTDEGRTKPSGFRREFVRREEMMDKGEGRRTTSGTRMGNIFARRNRPETDERQALGEIEIVVLEIIETKKTVCWCILPMVKVIE
jgi:hypothetical protein